MQWERRRIVAKPPHFILSKTCGIFLKVLL